MERRKRKVAMRENSFFSQSGYKVRGVEKGTGEKYF